MTDLGTRYRAVLESVEEAAREAGRAGAVTLVAVSKGHPTAALLEAFEAGARDFGENRVEELVRKRSELVDLLGAGAGEVRWHLIGQLQSRKIKPLEHVHLVHSVDRESQLVAFARRGGPRQDILLEVNIGEEPQKGGVMPEALEALCALALHEPALRLRGLMTIPPDRDDDAATLDDFRRMAALFAAMKGGAGEGFDSLSMGMSGDYRLAIEAGATLVRVGTAIFGQRGAVG